MSMKMTKKKRPKLPSLAELTKLKIALEKRRRKFDPRYAARQLSQSQSQLEQSLLTSSTLRDKNRTLARALANCQLESRGYQDEVMRVGCLLHNSIAENLALKKTIERLQPVSSIYETHLKAVKDLLKVSTEHFSRGSSTLCDVYNFLELPLATFTSPPQSDETNMEVAGAMATSMPSTSEGVSSRSFQLTTDSAFSAETVQPTRRGDLNSCTDLSIILETSELLDGSHDSSPRSAALLVDAASKEKMADNLMSAIDEEDVNNNEDAVPAGLPANVSDPVPVNDFQSSPPCSDLTEAPMSASDDDDIFEVPAPQSVAPCVDIVVQVKKEPDSDEDGNIVAEPSADRHDDVSLAASAAAIRRQTFVISNSKQTEPLPSPMLRRNRNPVRRTAKLFYPPPLSELYDSDERPPEDSQEELNVPFTNARAMSATSTSVIPIPPSPPATAATVDIGANKTNLNVVSMELVNSLTSSGHIEVNAEAAVHQESVPSSPAAISNSMTSTTAVEQREKADQVFELEEQPVAAIARLPLHEFNEPAAKRRVKKSTKSADLARNKKIKKKKHFSKPGKDLGASKSDKTSEATALPSSQDSRSPNRNDIDVNQESFNIWENVTKRQDKDKVETPKPKKHRKTLSSSEDDSDWMPPPMKAMMRKPSSSTLSRKSGLPKTKGKVAENVQLSDNDHDEVASGSVAPLRRTSASHVFAKPVPGPSEQPAEGERPRRSSTRKEISYKEKNINLKLRRA